jgi:hypothetical protein
MEDSELIAIAALANIEAVLMAADNAEWIEQGRIPPRRTGTGLMPAGTALLAEMKRRHWLQ